MSKRMIIGTFSKVFSSIQDINRSLIRCCPIVRDIMYNVIASNSLETFDDWVNWSLNTCIKDRSNILSYTMTKDKIDIVYTNGLSISIAIITSLNDIAVSASTFGEVLDSNTNSYKAIPVYYKVVIGFYEASTLSKNYYSLASDNWEYNSVLG